MRYSVDLNRVPLDEYLALLQRQTLLPSRRILKDGADQKFARIRAQGVSSVAQLLKALSTPVKTDAFAKQSGVEADYLKILRREAGTLRQKPVPLSAFPGTGHAALEALAARGIKTSKDYYEHGDQSGRLYTLCDLTRINGVGSKAAAMFYAAGCRSAAEIAHADVGALLKSVSGANAGKRYYAGTLGEKDMQFCIDFAQILLRFTQ